MNLTRISLLTFTVLMGQNLTNPASANPPCQNHRFVNEASPASENCLPNSSATESDSFISSISPPEMVAEPSSSREWIDGNTPETQQNHLSIALNNDRNISQNSQPSENGLNSQQTLQNESLFNHQINTLTTLLLDLTLSPLGAIAFLLLIKPLIIENIITDIRERMSELGKLELQLSTASQEAEILSNDFKLRLEELNKDYNQDVEQLKSNLERKVFSAEKIEAIKSDFLTQLQGLFIEVYDARDQALEKLSKIDVDALRDKVYRQLLNKGENPSPELESDSAIEPGKATAEDYMQQGSQLLQQGSYSDALIAYNQAIALASNNAEAWYHRGNTLGCLQHYQEALASYQRAIWLEDNRAEFWVNRGHILVRLQQYSEANDSYEKAIELKPDRAEYWQHKGNLLARLKKYRKAIKAYDEACSLEPEKYYVWHLKGNLLAKMQQTEEAVISYKKAVSINPKKYESWYNLGNALGQLDRYVESVNAYNQALELKDNDYKIWHNRGFMLGKMQRYEAAIASYEKATRLNAKNYESWYNRGNLLEQLHRYDEAIASYDRAIEIRPDEPRLWYNCGKILEKLQRYEEALISYEKAIKIEPNRSEDARVSLNYLLAKINN